MVFILPVQVAPATLMCLLLLLECHCGDSVARTRLPTWKLCILALLQDLLEAFLGRPSLLAEGAESSVG